MEKRKRSTRVWQKLKIAQEHNKAKRKLKEKTIWSTTVQYSREQKENGNKISTKLARDFVF